MLAAGIEDGAARWWPVVADGDDAASRSAWALLAVGANGGIAVSPARFRAWAKDVGPHRAALFLAALDGLGSARGAAWDRVRSDAGRGSGGQQLDARDRRRRGRAADRRGRRPDRDRDCRRNGRPCRRRISPTSSPRGSPPGAATRRG